MTRFQTSKQAVPTTTTSHAMGYMPLCEGAQTTSLFVQNDTRTELFRMSMSADGGHTWQDMGLLDPVNSIQMWRQTGETWRLTNASNGVIGAQTVTAPPRTRLWVGEHQS